MGLWAETSEWSDYEWFRLSDVPDAPPPKAAAPRAAGRRGGPKRPGREAGGGAPAVDSTDGDGDAGAAMGRWLVQHLADDPLWAKGPAARVLLVDLDNLRAAPSRLQARLALVVELAREADQTMFAGQAGAVRRSRPWLEEYAEDVQEVPDGSDLADHALLDRAATVTASPVQFLVVSNDGIFAQLADRGPLALLSPGADAMSDRLSASAHRVVDLPSLEQQAAAERARTQRAARRRDQRNR